MRILAALLCMGLAGCVSTFAHVHETTVLLTMDDGTCSGTVIGPHAILTAEHCLTSTKTLAVDNKLVEVRKVTLDHADHALVILNVTFTHWAERGTSPYQSESIFNIGNPGDLRDMYRRGYVAGNQVMRGRKVTLYDTNGYYGDSGSGIFDEDGRLIAVTSIIYQQADNGYIKFMGSFDLAFTAREWREASI